MVDMLQPPVTYYEVFTALYATLQTHSVAPILSLLSHCMELVELHSHLMITWLEGSVDEIQTSGEHPDDEKWTIPKLLYQTWPTRVLQSLCWCHTGQDFIEPSQSKFWVFIAAFAHFLWYRKLPEPQGYGTLCRQGSFLHALAWGGLGWMQWWNAQCYAW